MKPVTVKAATGRIREFAGWPTGVPGLLVAELKGIQCRGKWRVCHARSGTTFAYCLPDPEAALGLARALTDVADWRQVMTSLMPVLASARYMAAVEPYRAAYHLHAHATVKALEHDNGLIA